MMVAALTFFKLMHTFNFPFFLGTPTMAETHSLGFGGSKERKVGWGKVSKKWRDDVLSAEGWRPLYKEILADPTECRDVLKGENKSLLT